jgi:hypothetical protein
MAVWVDRSMSYPPYGKKWCHLISDTDDLDKAELHAFALKIGLRRQWFQGNHYDLTESKRKLAVIFGAREASSRKEFVSILHGNN